MASDRKHDAVAASKGGVHVGHYGNCFATVNIELGGFRFVANLDQSSFTPHIKIMDQKMQLNRVADLLVDCINRGADSLKKEGGAE